MYLYSVGYGQVFSGFASRPGHTKDYYIMKKLHIPAWHAMRFG